MACVETMRFKCYQINGFIKIWGKKQGAGFGIQSSTVFLIRILLELKMEGDENGKKGISGS